MCLLSVSVSSGLHALYSCVYLGRPLQRSLMSSGSSRCAQRREEENRLTGFWKGVYRQETPLNTGSPSSSAGVGLEDTHKDFMVITAKYPKTQSLPLSCNFVKKKYYIKPLVAQGHKSCYQSVRH